MTSLSSFIFAVIVLLIVPGPTNALLATSGATVGLYRSLPLLACELIGYEVGVTWLRLLVAPRLERLHGPERMLRIAAALYLTTLAITLWRTRLHSGVRAIRTHQVLITTLLNPKVFIVALVLIPLGGLGGLRYWLLLSLIVPLAGALWIALGEWLGRAAPKQLATVIPRLASIVLGLFAVLLVAA